MWGESISNDETIVKIDSRALCGRCACVTEQCNVDLDTSQMTMEDNIRMACVWICLESGCVITELYNLLNMP